MTQRTGVMLVKGSDLDEVSILVLRAREGDHEAFGELVEYWWSDLVRVARGITAIDREAEDVVQESFVQAWNRLWTLRKPGSFGAWMRRIVVRRSLTRARRLRPAEALIDPPQVAPDSGARYDVARLLSSLAPRQRAALYLTWIEGYTDREVGLLLGIRAATVRVHRHRGLQQLRQMVEGDGQ